jgi:hypothetical protein
MTKNERIEFNLEVNEGETPSILATAYDGSNVAIEAALISGVYVRVDDYHSDTALMPRTAISSLTNPTSFTLSHSFTMICNSERPYEYRLVTLEYIFQASRHIPDEYVLKVKNLKYHSV